jgi:hypothetical protein
MNKYNKAWLAAGAVFAIMVFCAWRSNVPDQLLGQPGSQDTIPSGKKYYSEKNEFTIGEIDKAMREMERAMADMHKNMNIDFGKMDKEIKQAMEEIKNVDVSRINKEIQASLKSVDWDNIRVHTDKALREAEARLKEVDMKGLQVEMDKLKTELDANKLKMHIDMGAIHKSVEAGLAGARLGIEKAKLELAKFKEFINALDKDGLIDKDKAYRVEIKNGELYINGNKQSKEVNDKYRKYFGENDYTIKSDGEGVVRL